MKKKQSGVLLHISSLPATFGIGDFGPAAFRFADFLKAAQQSIWQVLPLNVPEPAAAYSPYSSASVYAGNTLFISLEFLLADGLLQPRDLEPFPGSEPGQVDFGLVAAYKEKYFDLAYQNFLKQKPPEAFLEFCQKNAGWLEDYVLFQVLTSRANGAGWSSWFRALREREPDSLAQTKKVFAQDLEKGKFLQFIFYQQWFKLKNYCHDCGIKILGDIPIYVDYNCCDLWVDPQICKLDKDQQPAFLAGVPPDYFCQTGQLWKNPVYDWEYLEKTNFKFWLDRIKHNLKIFDLIRLDHFRGLVAFWQIPAGAKTAEAGKWIKVPAENFLSALKSRYPDLPIIAEDLGVISDEVREIMARFSLPGMKVLLFAFGEDNPEHPYLPHNYISNCVVYTGTHDNNTVRGWFEQEADGEEKKRLFSYLGREVGADQVAWELVQLAEQSRAEICILPFQDLLGLGAGARMNTPGTTPGNWKWKLLPSQLDLELAARLAELTRSSNRV